MHRTNFTAGGLVGLTVSALLAASAAAQCWQSQSACGEPAKTVETEEQASYTTLQVQYTEQRSGPTIVEAAASTEGFSTLVKLVQLAELDGALSGKGPFTVFAPTDDAFAKLDPALVRKLTNPENRDLLRSVLMYHVVAGDVRAEQVVEMETAPTLGGQRVDIAVTRRGVKLDAASVTRTDLVVGNGVIHVIDTVLLPETKNLAEVASGAGSFTTLVSLAKTAGLVPALTGDEPLTILAPTDEAFEALGVSSIVELLLPENRETLKSILKDHVIAGRVYADQVAGIESAGAISGRELAIDAGRLGVTIEGARVIAADIEASNGVIHVIDRVITPAK